MGEKVDRAMDIASDFLCSGNKVILVSRMLPDLLSGHWFRDEPEHIWLSERPSELSMGPDQLSRIAQRLIFFAESNRNSVLVIEGLDYLGLFNDFARLQMFVEHLNDTVMETGSIMILAIDPRSFDPRSLARLRRFAEIVE